LKIGFSTLSFLEKPLTLLSRLLEELSSIKVVEIAADWNHRLNQHRLQFLQELRESHRLEYTLHCPFTDINIATANPTLRGAIKRIMFRNLQYAHKLECGTVVVHPGLHTALNHFKPSLVWENTVSFLNQLYREAENLGFTLAVENLPKGVPTPFTTVNAFKKLQELLAYPLKIALDVGHAHTSGEVLVFPKVFKDLVVHAHLHDNKGDYDQHLPIGEGTIPWKELLQQLLRSSCSTFIIEMEKWAYVPKSLETLLRLLPSH